jgi:diguanylate cyclase (GGDEF)-like protein
LSAEKLPSGAPAPAPRRGGAQPASARDWSDWQQDRLKEIGRAFSEAEPLGRDALLEALNHAIREAVASGEPAACVLIDLNNFAEINAAWGLPVGNQLLAAIAARLQAEAAQLTANSGHGVRVGRLDADHFVLVVPGAASAEALLQRVEAIVMALGRPYQLPQASMAVRARAAIVEIPAQGRSITTVLGRGFRLLNHAARVRPQGVAIAEAGSEQNASAALLERDLAAALNGDDFFIALQPKLAIATGRLGGAEALARWRHPRHGLVPPPAFIEAAERSGLIVDLGLRVLRDACRAARSLKTDGEPLKIAVNVSPHQLAHADFLSRFLEVVDGEGAEPSALQIELTETAAAMGGASVQETLQALKRCGIGVAIDDFGTGFSNLASLAALPADTLKLDRSLIIGWQAGGKAAALLDIAVHLARTFGMATVAEGVETEAQLNHVREIGCDFVQGFLTGRPVPAADFSDHYLSGGRA